MIATKRNLGIELLRMVSMMMILCLHCLGLGCLTIAYEFPQNIPFIALQALSFGAANLYALITGYACIKSSHRWHRCIQLWLQVVFYALGICLISLLLGHDVSKKIFIFSFIPVTSNLYWYFTSYFMLFCLIPFLNKLLSGLTKQQFKKLLFVGFTLMCLIGWLGDYMHFKPFLTNNGYSPVWLIYLYCVGAYIRIYSEDFKAYRKRTYIGIYAGCVLLMLLNKYLLPLIAGVIPEEIALEQLFWIYLSPAVAIGAVALFLFFANLEIKESRLISVFAPCSFGVYLLHIHPISRLLVRNGLIGCAQMPWYQALGCMALFMITVFTAGLLIDYLRSKLFALLHVPQFAEWLEEKLKVFARRVIR